MEMNGGFLVTKIKQLGDRIFEKILSEKNIDAFNGAQGRILYVLWQEDGISIRSLSTKCGLAIISLTTMLERMENQGLIVDAVSAADLDGVDLMEIKFLGNFLNLRFRQAALIILT